MKYFLLRRKTMTIRLVSWRFQNFRRAQNFIEHIVHSAKNPEKTLNNISAIASYVDSNGHRIHPSIVSSDKSAFRPIQHEKNSEKFHAVSERLAQEQSSQSPTKRVRRRSFSDSEVSIKLEIIVENRSRRTDKFGSHQKKLLLTKIVFRIEKEKRRVIQPSLGLIMTH